MLIFKVGRVKLILYYRIIPWVPVNDILPD
jgi:hypothetical protein